MNNIGNGHVEFVTYCDDVTDDTNDKNCDNGDDDDDNG